MIVISMSASRPAWVNQVLFAELDSDAEQGNDARRALEYRGVRRRYSDNPSAEDNSDDEIGNAARRVTEDSRDGREAMSRNVVDYSDSLGPAGEWPAQHTGGLRL